MLAGLASWRRAPLLMGVWRLLVLSVAPLVRCGAGSLNRMPKVEAWHVARHSFATNLLENRGEYRG